MEKISENSISSETKLSDILELLKLDKNSSYNLSFKIVNNNLKFSAPRFIPTKIHPYFEKINKEKEKVSENYSENSDENSNEKCNKNTTEKYSHLNLISSKKILIFTPHPDDETFGASLLINQLATNKNDFTIIYMTSGKGGGDVNIRKTESISGVKILGGEEKNCEFHSFPFYEKLGRTVTEEDQNYLKEILERHSPSEVFICADVFDPNGTHRKCFDILLRDREMDISKASFYFYYSVWYYPRLEEISHVIMCDERIFAEKVLAMLAHKSQILNNFMGDDDRPFYQRTIARDKEFGDLFKELLKEKDSKNNYCEVFYLIKN